MKNIFLSLLTIVALSCTGQPKDSLFTYKYYPVLRETNGSVYGDSDRMGKLIWFVDSIAAPKPDTVRYLLLLCDTSHNRSPYFEEIIFTTDQLAEDYRRQQHQIWWDFGYRVSENWKTFYIDERKNPIPKNIVVLTGYPLQPRYNFEH